MIKNLKIRIMLFVFLVTIPVIGLFMFYAGAHIESILSKERQNLNYLAQEISAQHVQKVKLGQNLLTFLAEIPEINGLETAQSSKILDDLHLTMPYFTVFGLVNPDGILLSASRPFPPGFSSAHLKWFKTAVTKKDFAMGEYQIGRISKKPILSMGLPVLDTRGDIRFVLVTAMDLSWLEQFMENERLKGYRQYRVLITGPEGKVLAAFPAEGNVNTSLGLSPVFNRIRQTRDEVVTDTDFSGKGRYLHASHPIDTAEYFGYVIVSADEARIVAVEKKIIGNHLLRLSGVLALAFVFAWILSQKWFVTPIHRLIDFARKIGKGELKERIQVGQKGDQFDQLASALNDMVDRLQNQEDSEKKAKAGLIESEELFRHSFENANNGALLVGLKGQILKVNRKMCDLFGYSKAELTAMTVDDFTIPEDRHLTRAHMEKRDDAEVGGMVFEKRYFHRDGHIIHGLVSTSMVRDATGKPLFYIFHVQDISSQKQMMEEITENKQRFYSALMNIPEAIAIYDGDQRYLFVNRQLQKIFGMPEGRFIGFQDQDIFPPEVYGRYVPLLEKTFATRQTQTGNIIIELPTGKYHLYLKLIPIVDHSGQVSQVLAFAQDMTERERLREKADQHLEQAIRADRLASLGEVVAGVGHEINNPNSFISFNLPLLEEIWQYFKPVIKDYAKTHPEAALGRIKVPELIEDMDGILVSIQKGAERISKVVQELKQYALPEESKEHKPVNLNTVVQNTLAVFGTKLTVHEDNLILDLDADLPEIEGNTTEVEQIMVNLLLNANHAVAGKKDDQIIISTRYVSGMAAVLFSIQDNGTGMRPEDLKKAFDPFFTTRRQDGGSGLGLSITHTLVKEHGGLIAAASRLGKGSCFSVFLPVNKETELIPCANVLVIDDDPSVLKLLESKYLKVDTIEIKTLSNPNTVIAHLDHHPEIDLILSDVMMPETDGWQLFRQINENYPLMPFILYSGSSKALDNPFDDIRPDYIIQKPFGRNRLIKLIQEASRVKL